MTFIDRITHVLMKETAKLRKIITKRGTLEILIPLWPEHNTC